MQGRVGGAPPCDGAAHPPGQPACPPERAGRGARWANDSIHASKTFGVGAKTFAEKLRGWGIEAEASSQATRGVSRRSLRGWERQPGAAARTGKKRSEHKSGPAFRATRSSALQAWAEITKALAASPDPADRKLSKSIVDFMMQTDVARALQRHRAAQRQAELPGMSMDRGGSVQRVLPERSRDLDMSR